MQMMYEVIHKALVETGLQNTYEPQDFLNFFCLGKREASDEISAVNSDSSSPDGSTTQVKVSIYYSVIK